MAAILRGAICAALFTSTLAMAMGGGAPGASAQGIHNRVNPVASGDAVRNVTFYYGGTTTLAGSDPVQLATTLGRPAIVVSTAKADEAGTVKAIHDIGAKAYRYVQFFWAPGDSTYEGIDLDKHPGWMFCREGTTPSLGRETDDGAEKWYFLDTNESAVRRRIASVLSGYRAEGWDGVFFDRGEAATQNAKDIHGQSIWYRQSSCTGRPYKRGARFADAYVNVLGLAHGAGLQVMMNNGKSPFDPRVPMRPDPGDSYCQAHEWSKCRFLSDVWKHLDLVLNESAAKPEDDGWNRSFTGNSRSELSAAHGLRTVALITTATLGGASKQNRHNVFFEWSRIKLFNLATAVNTGDGGCPPTLDPTQPCNHYGVYPELVDTAFGRPLSASPRSMSCVNSSTVHCLWLRRYDKGVSVVNVGDRRRSDVPVTLNRGTCRYVYDVYSRSALAGNRCVTRVHLDLSGWSGHPLRYSRHPWERDG
jgi:hypothetical protein